MQPKCLGRASVPSPALLRFLRAQTEPQNVSLLAADRPRAGALRHRQPFSPTTIRCAQRDISSIHTPATIPSLSARPLLFSDRPAVRASFASYTPRRNFSIWDLFGSKKKKASRPLQPNDLPSRDSFVPDDGGNPMRVPRPTNELKLRCTEFDENGNVTLMDSEFRKTELLAKYGLLPRDLRKIDSSTLPHILVRPSAILLNLLHLRVLIKHDRVLVFDAYGTTNSYAQSIFIYDLQGRLRQRDLRQSASLPYEFRALEAVLLSVTSGLESEFEGVREPVVTVLRELEEDIDRDKLRYLLIYSKKLGTFEQQARLVRDALDELLEADDDLASMYLTEKFEGKVRGEDNHTEVEMLLESYHKVADEIVQAAENLVSSIRNTEEIVKAILDANRNSLMLLDLKFSVWTVGLAAGTFVAALYGMNLKNFIEESDFGFWGVSIWCTVFTALCSGYGLVKLRRVQRVRMWGEHGRRSSQRGSWRDLGEVGILGPSPGAPPSGGVAGVLHASRSDKLKRLRDVHTQQAQGVNVEVQAAKKLHGDKVADRHRHHQQQQPHDGSSPKQN